MASESIDLDSTNAASGLARNRPKHAIWDLFEQAGTASSRKARCNGCSEVIGGKFTVKLQEHILNQCSVSPVHLRHLCTT